MAWYHCRAITWVSAWEVFDPRTLASGTLRKTYAILTWLFKAHYAEATLKMKAQCWHDQLDDNAVKSCLVLSKTYVGKVERSWSMLSWQSFRHAHLTSTLRETPTDGHSKLCILVSCSVSDCLSYDAFFMLASQDMQRFLCSLSEMRESPLKVTAGRMLTRILISLTSLALCRAQTQGWLEVNNHDQCRFLFTRLSVEACVCPLWGCLGARAAACGWLLLPM